MKWPEGEQDKLVEALRGRGTYTHPDVARSAAAGREAAIGHLGKNLGSSSGYDAETFEALGYQRSIDGRGNVAFVKQQELAWAAGHQGKLMEALREGFDYTHPAARRS